MAGNAASQSSKALLSLRDLILSGELAAGQKLSEVGLADRLGLSRTPIRDALMRLAGEGLLEKAGSSYAVRAFSIQDVRDAIELRGTMEGLAARLAAERGVSEALLTAFSSCLASLDAVVSPGHEEIDLGQYERLNSEFHDLLARAAGSATVTREVERASQLPFASASAFVKARERGDAFFSSLVHAQTQHHALADAIANREGARAEAIAREHARLARRNLDAVLSDSRLRDSVPGLKLVAS